MPRNVAVLGSTGSIGRQTLDIAAQFSDRVRVVALAAGSNARLLSEQAKSFRPRVVGMERVTSGLDAGAAEVVEGEAGMVAMASDSEVDLVVVGTSGRAGLMPTIAALRAGKLVALANKETLVSAGAIIREMLRAGHGVLVPIDSEHSAIWQCLQGEPERSIERLTLTASGGALRNLPIEALASVTPEQTLRHPTWSMGRKITVDSANLMNKGLEAIEARWLFDVQLERVSILMHPQSLIHSLVTFDDSSAKAQLGLPDMRLPIQYALSHPERWTNALPRLDLAETGSMTFGPVDYDRYPALRIALEAGRAGGTYPAILSAADEVAVDAFLNCRISFTQIVDVVRETLDRAGSCPSPSLDDILSADAWARDVARQLVSR
jgi:1-deoxy-D-xylulose-5-phosphate reductoisomerase